MYKAERDREKTRLRMQKYRVRMKTIKYPEDGGADYWEGMKKP